MGKTATSLPVLPHGWTWHIAPRSNGTRVRLVLCDATHVTRIVFRNENPGQFRDGSESYAKLIKDGVRVAKHDDLKLGAVAKKARQMAEVAWFIHLARAELVDAHAASVGQSPTAQAEPVGGASPDLLPVEPAKEET